MAKERNVLDGKDNFRRLYGQTNVAEPRQNLSDMIKMLVKIITTSDQII